MPVNSELLFDTTLIRKTHPDNSTSVTITSDTDDLKWIKYHTQQAQTLAKGQSRVFKARLNRNLGMLLVAGETGFDRTLRMIGWLETLSYRKEIEYIALNPYLNALAQAFAFVFDVYPPTHIALQFVGEDARMYVCALNQAIADYRLTVNSHAFRQAEAHRKRGVNKNIASFKKMVAVLFSKHSKLLVIRLDTYYEDEMKRLVNHAGAEAHRNQLIAFIRQHFPAFVGYAWKLEFMPIRGLHYHWLLIFNGHELRADALIARLIGEHWVNNITAGGGAYHNGNAKDEKAKHEAKGVLGIGEVKRSDVTKRANLERAMRYLIKLDDYVRTKIPAGKRTFGKSIIKDKKI